MPFLRAVFSYCSERTDSFYLMIFSLDFVIAGQALLPIGIEKELPFQIENSYSWVMCFVV